MLAPALLLAVSSTLWPTHGPAGQTPPSTQGVALSPTAAGVDSGPVLEPIVGGMPVVSGAYPSVVAVVANPQLCTGTVITPTLVLTAAHCFSSASPGDEVKIYIGDTRTGTAAATSTDWATHPEYCGLPTCGDEAFDFAYVNFENPLPVDAIPQPLLTAQTWETHMSAGAPVTFVGFGNDNEGMQTNKLFTTSTITSFTPGRLQFRAGGMGKDSCIGDSGGPAFVQLNDGTHQLAGVLSAGSDPCGNGGMYGTTLAALDWLTTSGLYQAPVGSCTTIECLSGPLDTGTETGGEDEGEEDDEDGCRLRSTGSTPPISLALLALLGLLRRRRD